MTVDKKSLASASAKVKLFLDGYEFKMEPDPLDATSVHPESYARARRLLALVNVPVEQVGTERAIAALEKLFDGQSVKNIAEDIRCPPKDLEVIYECLTQPLDFDCRQARELPEEFGRYGSVGELRHGTVVVGRISNVVQFGCFVDLGIGNDGLIHVDYYGSTHRDEFQLGKFVKTRVIKFERLNGDRYNIGLQFMSFC
jgi:uncharacterized protein